MSWVKFRATGWKIHAVHSSLVEQLGRDAAKRFHETEDVSPITDPIFIDLPGMVMIDRTIQKFVVDGLTLEFPTQDFTFYQAELAEKLVREFDDGTRYFKLHGWMGCVVLTEDQAQDLRQQLALKADDAKAQARREDEEFTRRIESINKGEVRVVTPKVPSSMKDLAQPALVSRPNVEKN